MQDYESQPAPSNEELENIVFGPEDRWGRLAFAIDSAMADFNINNGKCDYCSSELIDGRCLKPECLLSQENDEDI